MASESTPATTAIPAEPTTTTTTAAAPIPSQAEAAAPTATAGHESTVASEISSTKEPKTEAPIDPRISQLVAIFPGFDQTLLLEIYERTGGDQDQAVDILLGMSDPKHVPSATLDGDDPRMEQELADAELAERLTLQDRTDTVYRGAENLWPTEGPDRNHALWGSESQSNNVFGNEGTQHELFSAEPNTDGVFTNGPYPYLPRQKAPHRAGGGEHQQHHWHLPGRHHAQQQQQNSTGADAAASGQAQAQGQAGKKTFDGLYSRLKAEFAKFDKSASRQGQASSASPQSAAVGQGSVPPSGVVSSPPTQTSSATAPAPAATAVAAAGTTAASAPDATAPAGDASIDRAKLGLLPKKPVSLANPQGPTSTDEDGDLYAPQQEVRKEIPPNLEPPAFPPRM